MTFSTDDVLAVSKRRDAWWTVLLTDPIAIPAVRWVANHSRVTPSQITSLAFLVGMCSAVCLAQGDWPFLAAGALLFQLSFVLDCMDGKLARLKGNGTVFGVWVDFIFDQIRFLACALALLVGRYLQTGQTIYLFFAIGVVFCDLFRYINSTQVAKVRRTMRRELAERTAATTTVADMAERYTDPDVEAYGRREGDEELHRRFHSRFPWYIRLRDRLLGHRIRTHLVSGIEFQMAVCVVAPLTTLILPVTAVAGALMLAFEAGLVAKLWMSAKDFERSIAPAREAEAETETETSPIPWAAVSR